METGSLQTEDIQALEELETLLDWVRWGEARLETAGVCVGHGYGTARDEAAGLALYVLGWPLEATDLDCGAVLSMPQRVRLDALIERRVRERRPAAYLIGETRFAGLPFKTDERALVPRSPIAELIEARYQPWVTFGGVQDMLDVGTGGGCIAVASAHYMPGIRVDAVDRSADALSLARENAAMHSVSERVRCVQSDLFDGVDGRQYDLIVGNPPYVGREEYDGLPPEFRREPPDGLLAGDRGLSVVVRLLADAPDHLRNGGKLIVEVGYSGDTLEALLPGMPFVWLDFERGGTGVFLLEGEAVARVGRAARAYLDKQGDGR